MHLHFLLLRFLPQFFPSRKLENTFCLGRYQISSSQEKFNREQALDWTLITQQSELSLLIWLLL